MTTFRDFQDLHEDLRDTLVYHLTARNKIESKNYLIAKEPAGEQPWWSMSIAELFRVLENESFQSMARCWLDCGRDMVRAKLTWTEDYK